MYLASYLSSQNHQALLLQANALKQARDNAKQDETSIKNNNLCQVQTLSKAQAATNNINVNTISNTQCLLNNTASSNLYATSSVLLQQGLAPFNYNSLCSLINRSSFIASINKNLFNTNLQTNDEIDFNLELLSLGFTLKHLASVNNLNNTQASSLVVADDSNLIYALFLFINVENIKRKAKKLNLKFLLSKNKNNKNPYKKQNSSSNQAFHEALLI